MGHSTASLQNRGGQMVLPQSIVGSSDQCNHLTLSTAAYIQVKLTHCKIDVQSRMELDIQGSIPQMVQQTVGTSWSLVLCFFIAVEQCACDGSSRGLVSSLCHEP